VGSWLGARNNDDNFLLLRFEDLKEDPLEGVERLSTFLGKTLNDQQNAAVVEYCSIENMRRLEKNLSGKWEPIRASKLNKPFVRQGKVGGWKNGLSSKLTAHIERAWGKTMKRVGYEISSG
jgi:hypothetical protein